MKIQSMFQKDINRDINGVIKVAQDDEQNLLYQALQSSVKSASVAQSSGTIFHKVVFAFKISYVKLIQRHTGVCLPIILDSPSGREVSMENVHEMMDILAKDFKDHQIIIASIYNNYVFPNINIIELTDRLLPF